MIGSAALLTVAYPATGHASPWLLDEDEVVLTGRFDHQWADREFLSTEDGFVSNPNQSRPFPLNGEYRSSTFVTEARLGLVDDIELSISVPIRSVTYSADPVILLPGGSNDGLDYYQENIIPSSKQVTGVADIRYGLAYQLFQGRMAGSLQLTLKTPTGYEQPAGTFGQEPRSEGEFRNNPGQYVQPDNVQDDVTLGAGQPDLTAAFQWGWALPSKTFIRADAGYSLRLGGAADELRTGLQIGQTLGDTILLTAGANFVYAVESGDSVGLSVAANDPGRPAEDYRGLQNIELRQTPLERDLLSASAGMIIRISEAVEGTVTYTNTLWGQNIADSQTLSLGTAVKFDISSPKPESDAGQSESSTN